MMLKGLTAQYLLRQTYRVKKGDTILVHAAAGGVGLILCQWGKALGATVIGVRRYGGKGELAKKCRGEAHDPLSRGGLRQARGRDHKRREMRCGLRRRRQGDLSGFARLPQAVRHFRRASAPPRAAIEAFNIGLLAQKGSLFATRPTLFTFMSDRARAEKMARDLFRVVGRGDVKIEIGRRWSLAEAGRGSYRARKARDDGLARSPAVKPYAAHGLSCAEFSRSPARRLAQAGRPCIGGAAARADRFPDGRGRRIEPYDRTEPESLSRPPSRPPRRRRAGGKQSKSSSRRC